MKTIVFTVALALASLSLMSAQTPAPATSGTTAAPVKAAKNHKKAVKKAAKKSSKTTPAPVAK